MSEQPFFPQSAPSDTEANNVGPASTSAAEAAPPVAAKEAAEPALSKPAADQPVPFLGADAASALARQAHQKTRRTLLIISAVVIVAVCLLVWLIVRLVKSPAAEQPAATATNTSQSTTSTPEPSLTLPAGSSSSSAGTAGWPTLTKDFVKSLTYPSPSDWTAAGWQDVPERYTLINGVARFEGGYLRGNDGNRTKVNLTVFVKDEAIGTGDIDGDGLADAVAVIKWLTSADNALPVMYTIFGNQPYSPELSVNPLSAVVGASYSATAVRISRNQASIDLIYPVNGEAACCWTGVATVNLGRSGGGWQAL